ncbi:MAG: stuC [Candidatus Saccharibacteria bacterium]|nr:stuC [Candidatus Saccharibacteria bacterium]
MIPAPNYKTVFESLPACHVLLSPGFVILAATASYCKATHTTPQQILNRNLFDIFPENAHTVEHPEGKNLAYSLKQVLRTKTAHALALQRYNLQVPSAKDSTTVERWWRLTNTPVLNLQQEIIYIISTVEDVTYMMDTLEEVENNFKAVPKTKM